MTIVVTGASGHIGGNLVRLLLARNLPCRALVRQDTRALDGLPLERVRGDVSDRESLLAAFQGAEHVFHLAGRISIVGDPTGEVARTNVAGVRNVVAACLAAKVKRLVHFSSIHAYAQAPLDRPLDETRAPVDPQRGYAYDRSKAGGEREIRAGIEQGLDAVIVNPTGVIGPYDFKPSRMGQVFLDLYHRKLLGLVAGGFNWVDARDVAAGALAALEQGQTGERYLLAGHYRTIAETAAAAERVTGVRAPRLVTPMWLARAVAPFAELAAKLTGGEPLFTAESLGALRANRNIRADKASRELGYAPRPFEATVADIYDWFRSTGACGR